MLHHSQNTLDALFIGYENQENLGLRSIIATLRQAGYRARLQPFLPGDQAPILAAIQKHEPALVGFSVIFQYTLDEFARLAAYLRKSGVKAHFTMGGHYPSLRPSEALSMMPDMDSVVRFEGELIALELLEKLHNPASWDTIEGLAFRNGTDTVINPPRPLVSDLNTLPPPVRGHARTLPRNTLVASILASRGCLYDCSFCSIRQFYAGAPGPLRRSRTPENVVQEMRTLFIEEGVRFFIFQDDDFAARSRQQRLWINDFLHALDNAGIADEVRWKIACRVDDVDEDVLARCQEHGLIAVYLGVESGSEQSLLTLNKRVTVAQNHQAIATLKQLDLTFDMGFMLFDPDSTVDTIQENLDFLREVTADGCCPANFCKMLPYAGTPIEQRLRQEGRLKGTTSQPDYDFIDERVNWYMLFASRAFRFRNFDRLGLVERLRLTLFDLTLAKAFEDTLWLDEYEQILRSITARTNIAMLDTMQEGLDFVKSQDDADGVILGWPVLGEIAKRSWQAETGLQRELDDVLKRDNPELLRAFAEEFGQRAEKMHPTVTDQRHEMRISDILRL